MLSNLRLENFFVRHSIPLEGEKLLSISEVDRIILSANKIGYPFACFIQSAVLNAERNGIHTFFKSYDDLFECYSFFMIGFNSHTAASN